MSKSIQITFSKENKNEKIKNMRFKREGLEREGFCWTDKELNELWEDTLAGVGVSDLALKFHRSEGAIFQQQNLLRTNNGMRHRYRTSKYDKPCRCCDCVNYESCPFSPLNREVISLNP